MQRAAAGWVNGFVGVVIFSGSLPATRVAVMQFDPVFLTVARAAIAGVLGAYLLLYPFARVMTLIPFFVFWHIIEIPAIIVLGIWFIFQFASAALANSAPDAGGVAWWAHVGGFIAGMILLGFFLPRRRGRRARRWT